MAKGRLYKPRAFALGLLCHMKNDLCIYLNEKRGTLRMPRHQFCNWLSHYKLTVLPSDHDRYTVFCVSIYSWKSTS